jgi:PAS domain-containing protein
MLRLWTGAETNAGFYAIAAILAAAIFAFDMAMPLGVAGGVPYVALVLLGLWSPGRGNVLALGVAASALTVLGFYLSPEGGTPWVVMTNRALALFAIWVTAFMVCQRLRRREELNKTTTLLTTTFATIAQGICVHGADGNLVAFNKSYEEMFSFPPGFLRRGLPYEQIVRFRAEAGQFGDGDVEELVRARMERPTQVIEYTRERTLPTGLVYSMHRKPMPNGGYVNAFTDITEHRRVEQTAAEKSALLDTALETMAQGFAVFDSDQKVVTYNKKYIEMSGLPAGCQPLGMSYEELLRLRAKEGKTARRITEDIIQKRLNNRFNARGAISERVRGDGTAATF